MKIAIYKTVFSILFASLLACGENELFTKEQYKNIIYVLSQDDNTFPVEHNLDTPENMGYLTLYSGGSLSVNQEVLITLESDNELLKEYNLLNFDLDTTKYAKELDKSKYTIDSYTAVLQPTIENPYVLLPIKIRPEGLSPDSLYMIPLKIQSASNYEINLKKNRVLYQVLLKNDFAQQKSKTLMSMRGTRKIGDGVEIKIAANKQMYPLSKQKVRINAGMENSGNKADIDLINKNSLILEVGSESLKDKNGNEYRQITISPYKNELIQVEQIATIENTVELDAQEANRYVTELGVKRFRLSYKYRTLKSVSPEGQPAVWNNWIIITENMKRMTQ